MAKRELTCGTAGCKRPARWKCVKDKKAHCDLHFHTDPKTGEAVKAPDGKGYCCKNVELL